MAQERIRKERRNGECAGCYPDDDDGDEEAKDEMLMKRVCLRV